MMPVYVTPFGFPFYLNFTPNTIHSYSTLSIYPFLKGRECEKAIRQAKVSSKTLTTELNDPDKKETWAR